MRTTAWFLLLLGLALCLAYLPVGKAAAANLEDLSDPSDEEIDSDDDAAVEVDEYGRVFYEDDHDFEDTESMAGHEAEVYVIDEKVEGNARATLVLDEVTEYYDEAGQSWFKVQLHLLNAGEAPLCGAVFWVSDPATIAEAWTLEKVKAANESNLYKLLWSNHVSAGESRFFGLVTHGNQVPDIGFHAITACEHPEESDDETDDEDHLPSGEHAFGTSKDAVMEEEDEDDDDNTITLQVDELSEYVLLAVDEVQDWSKKSTAKARQVLVNAHVTNTANFAICGISIWIYGFPAVKQYWSVVPIKEEGSEELTDLVYLPSAESDLEPGQTHHFGFVMEITTDFPNMAVINARDCQMHERAASKDQALN